MCALFSNSFVSYYRRWLAVSLWQCFVLPASYCYVVVCLFVLLLLAALFKFIYECVAFQSCCLPFVLLLCNCMLCAFDATYAQKKTVPNETSHDLMMAVKYFLSTIVTAFLPNLQPCSSFRLFCSHLLFQAIISTMIRHKCKQQKKPHAKHSQHMHYWKCNVRASAIFCGQMHLILYRASTHPTSIHHSSLI